MTRFFCAIILLATIAIARAGSWTWNGAGGNVNWSTGGNWGGSAPTSANTTDLFFDGSTNTGTAGTPLNQNIGAPFLLNSLTFNNTAGSFFLGGGALRFDGGSSNSILQNSANAQSIANNINAPSTNAQRIITLGGNGTGVVTLSGVIASGSGSRDYALVKTGTSVFSLTGANTYAGGTTINGGTLIINSSANLGANTGGLTINAGTLEVTTGFSSNRTFTLGNTASTLQIDPSQTLTITSAVLGTGVLNKTGTGILVLSGANTYSGGSTLNGGTTIVNSVSSLGATGGLATINAATLEVAATFLTTRNYALGNANSTIQVDPTFVFTLNGVVSGTGTLNKTGTGTLILGGANTYSGATNISAGTLRDGTTNVIPDTSALTVASSATFDLNTFSESIGSLAGGGTVTSSAAGAVTLTAGGDNTSTVFSGILQNGSGTLAFTKSGTGTLTLSGANTYSGLTTIAGGILDIQNANGLGTIAGSTTVNAGASLQLQSGITLAAEPLTLNGTGYSSFGALRNFSGNNSLSGAITLGSASTIYSDAGTLTLSGGITNGGFVSTFDGAGNINESGTISGLGGITKTGSGTLTLGGANSYTGNTTISGGTLAVSSNGNLGGLASTINLNAGTLEITTGFSTARTINLGNAASTFQVDASQIFTVSVAITGTGTLNKTGSGTMVLSGMNLFSGGTNVAAGTLQISAVDRLLTTAGLTISGGTFDLQTFGQTTGAVTLSGGSITGTGAGTLTGTSFTLQSGSVSAILGGNSTVTKNTAGTVTLSGANTFTGSTTISAGTLQVNTNNALGTAASGTTVANGAVLKLNNVNYATAEPLTLNGSGISNGGALLNSGTSTFAGSINAATNATINAGGGTLNLTGGISKNGTTLTIAGGGTVNITTNGITGSSPNSDLVVDGTTVVLSAANSYNGPTTIQNSGTLKLGNSNVLPTSPQTDLTINTSSIFDLASYSDGVASLTGQSSAIIKNSVVGGTSTLTINPGSGVSTTFAGVIAGTNGGTQGNMALQKNGLGTLTLTGANTYSGSTVINGGTLTVANSSGSALGSTSNVTVNSGGTFLLGQSDQVNNTATVTLAGGTFAKGNFSEGSASAPGVGALTLTASGSHLDFGTGTVGVLTFASFTPGSFTLTIDNWTGTPNTQGTGSTDRLIFASDQSGNLGNFFFTGYAGAVEFNLLNGYWEVTPVAVPETSTWVAAALALGVTAFHLVRKRALLAVRIPKSPRKFPG